MSAFQEDGRKCEAAGHSLATGFVAVVVTVASVSCRMVVSAAS